MRKFKKLFIDADEYTIHSFEPNPSFKTCYQNLKNVVFHEEAVWILDGEVVFYLSDNPRQQGSTLIRSKATGCLKEENSIVVKCIDFSKWIKNNLEISQYIVLKMDIEGAEYEILKKMIQDNSIKYVNQLYIEFHYDKIGMLKQSHDQIIKKLAQYNLKIDYWDALSF